MNYIKNEIVNKNILLIKISNESQLNALNSTLLNELNEVISDYENDDSVRCIIITGKGEKAFAAGADIKEMQKMSKDEAFEYSKLGSNLFSKIENLSKPVIAAINGFALGGGCELAMSCHIRYASSNALLGQPEVKLGLITGFGGSQRITKNLTKSLSMEMLLTGKNYSADESFKIGLVNKIFDTKADLIDYALKTANIIIQNSPKAITKSIQLINQSYNLDDSDGFNVESIEFGKLFNEKETDEGLTAFIEKRKPKF
tara:strand:+ start:2784 stop:3557 length:774 start_codon:yes stop_codon:yes gene_type:complete